MHFGGMARAQTLHHLPHGKSCVNNVFHDNDNTVGKVFVDAQHLVHISRGSGALIGSQFHERDFTGYGDFAHQVGSKDKSTVQHSQEKGILSCKVVIDTFSNRLHTLTDFLFRNRDSERFILNFYRIHCFRN